jgi:hypothetical protein
MVKGSELEMELALGPLMVQGQACGLVREWVRAWVHE